MISEGSIWINNLINQSRASRGVIKCNFYQSRFLILVTYASTGDLCIISTKIASFPDFPTLKQEYTGRIFSRMEEKGNVLYAVHPT